MAYFFKQIYTSFAVNLVKNVNRDAIVSMQCLHSRLKMKKIVQLIMCVQVVALARLPQRLKSVFKKNSSLPELSPQA